MSSAPIETPANSQPRLFGESREPGLGQLREDRLRPGEQHRDDVDDEGHEQHRLGAQEREALAHAADGRTAAAAAPATRRGGSDGSPRSSSAATRKPSASIA